SGSVTVPDFGNPTAATDYTLKLVDQAGTVMTISLPAGGICDDKPCWTTTGSGAKYKSHTGMPTGLLGGSLKAGVAGHAQIKIKGKGASLPMSRVALVLPATVEFLRADTGTCWEAMFHSAKVDSATAFRAKSD